LVDTNLKILFVSDIFYRQIVGISDELLKVKVLASGFVSKSNFQNNICPKNHSNVCVKKA